jgi:hypothetical protein
MQPLMYSRFRLWDIIPADLDTEPYGPFPFGDGAVSRAVGTGIDEPACQIVYEDFVAGPPYQWTVWQDQIDVVTDGRAEITYWEPPDQATPTTIVAQAPCVYLLPRGTRVVWKVVSDGPFRHFSIDFPNPGFSVPLPARLRAQPSKEERA